MGLHDFEVIIPAKNEAAGLSNVLPDLIRIISPQQIIVVNDGSTDTTERVCREHGVQIVNNPYSKGNGAAIKAGARHSTAETIIFMDGDGQHNPEDIPRLLEEIQCGYDMVVGARDDSSQASAGRAIANSIYNRFASYMTGHHVADLTSGFRAVRRKKFMEFLHLLPNTFSYPTTITMAFFHSGYSISYLPISTRERTGESHINLIEDGTRFFLIIFKVGTLFSPLKIFFPISSGFFALGIGYYLYTYLSDGRFTNMGALLLSISVLIFLIGLVSEQITQLLYSSLEK